jgi:cytochrome c oxidase subunit 3
MTTGYREMDAEMQAPARASNGRVALFLILASETVLFATLVVSYIALRGQSGWDVEHTLRRLAFPILNTCILMGSAVLASLALRAIQNDRQGPLRGRLMAALLLGLVFVAGQMYEFRHAGLQVSGQEVGALFFALMSFHALHVLAGVVVISLSWMRARLGDFSARRHEAVSLGVWFWYYVCAVWLVLFGALYLI